MATDTKWSKDDCARFAAMMYTLGQAYRVKVSVEMIEAYEIALGDCSMDDIGRRAKYCMQTLKFFPKPAELRSPGMAYRARWLAIGAANRLRREEGEARRLEHRESPPLRIEYRELQEELSK